VRQELAFCTVANPGKKTVDVTVEFIDAQSGDAIGPPTSCTVDPLRACVVDVDPANSIDVFILCHITTDTKSVRGVLSTQSGAVSETR
jgi:hypothetical protein